MMDQDSFEMIISKLPFPVAFRSRFILYQTDMRSRLESIIDAYESLLRFLALVVISDYLRGVIEEPSIDERLKKLFGSRISPGHWLEILREILKAYAKSPQDIYMPELLDFYLTGKKVTPEGKKFEAWVNRRNKFRSHSLRLNTEDVVRETWSKWWPEFQECIGQFSFLVSYEMIVPAFIQKGLITKAKIYTGPNPFFIFNEKYDLPLTIKGVEPEESLLVLDKRKPTRQLLLYPFIVVRASADFYLFEQGVRRKGDLERVVFASLGPGEALEIRRADEGKRIIEDLENRLQRFGEIGISLEDLPDGSFVEAPESPIFHEANKIAEEWAEAGYPYYMIEGISEKLRAQIRHPQKDAELPEGDVLPFIMVASLHYGGDWCFWVEKNKNSPQVLEHLFRVLGISYDRPRFRALFALQYLDSDEIKRSLDGSRHHLSPDIHKIISEYVVPGKIADYLSRVKREADEEVAKKASGVLREISQYSGLIIDDEESSGLPVM